MPFARLLILVSLIISASSSVSTKAWGQGTDSAPALLLYNELDDAQAVTTSLVGPDLAFWDPTLGGTGCCHVAANPCFVPGVQGNGLTICPGPYAVHSLVHNVVLADTTSVLDPERGTIDVWLRLNNTPQVLENNPFRVFDGPWGFGPGVELFATDVENYGAYAFGGGSYEVPSLALEIRFGGPPVIAESVVTGKPGVPLADLPNQEWMRLHALWDRAGIDGSADTLRLYVDGALVAHSSVASWGATTGVMADIGGGNDDQIAGSFELDRLRIWDGPVVPASTHLDGFPASISVSAGGSQSFALWTGSEHALKIYFLAGTTSGTVPGLAVGSVTVPLNLSPLLLYSINHPSTPPYIDSLGFLSAYGTASAKFSMPGGSNPGLAGLTLNHAFLVWDAFGGGGALLASNAVAVALVP